MPEPRYQTIIFDLDGTLLDTSKGIKNSVRHAEQMMGFEPVPEPQLIAFFGPPPKKVYQALHGLNDDKALEAARHHREYAARKGIYEAFAFEDIENLLIRLQNEGRKLAIATLKREDIARAILAHFKLDQYFDAIVGQNFAEDLTKTQTINLAIEQLQHSDRARILMVGDSEGDYKGALEAGIDFLGVTFGFGFEPEASQTHPDLMLVSTVQDLGDYFDHH